MKVAILGDTHFGCRNDLTLFHKHFEKFYDHMLGTLEDAGVDVIIQLGDLFDRRKYVNFNTLNESRRYFFDRLREKNIRLITLVGNHDIYWREKLTVNSADLLLRDYANITVCSSPTTLTLADDSTIDIIPWICADNEQEVKQFIAESKSDLCAGHFEIENFQMYRGVESHGGLPVNMFAKYERVLSGHYHTRSERENITYVGTPYEMTWQDFNDPKGFHLFDLETRELQFFENPNKIFVRLDYSDADPKTLDLADLADCFIKVVVTNKTDLYKFDQYIQKLYTKGCFEVKIVEDMSEFSDGEIGEEIDLEDTMDVLSNYIDSIETSADKDKIKQFMKSLYVEAINVEVVE